ncbi:MAG: POTRA domain-containing protein [Candidatus Saccharicenans sp.]|uniref:POTRA domain-containing protein n=1 Tax=Candidatus Saccharicenans sp. TaxID=2819258 RepID=UPI00404AFD29
MKAGVWLSVIILLITASSLYPADNSHPVGKITILVDGQEAEPAVSSLLNLRPGQSYSDYQIDQNLKQLMRTGFFSRAEVYYSGPQTEELTFVLTRNIFIRNVRMAGPRRLRKRIGEELSYLKKGGILSENLREKAASDIERILADEGLFSPQIEIDITKVEGTNLADVSVRLPGWRSLAIRQIVFEGQSLIPEDRLHRLLGLKSGDYYVPKKLEAGLARIKRAYNKIGYNWAEVKLAREEVDQQKGAVDLAISLNPSVKISVRLLGTNLSPKIVQPVWEQKVFEEWALSEGEALLLKQLRKRGYLLATVRPRLQREGNELLVIYEVHQGPKLEIKEIEFRGNQTFSHKEIKKSLGIGEKFLFFPYLDGQEVYDLPERIRLFYAEHGLAETRVNLNFSRKDNSVRPVYFIEEGPRQIVRSLEIQGAAALPVEEMFSLLDTRPGQPYYKPRLQRDLEKLNQLYLNRGFRGTQLEVEATPDRENNLDVVIRVNEGRRFRINNIFITGNHLTHKNIILREVRLRPGDWAEYNRLLETRRGLDSLGVFSEIKLEELPAADNSMNLSIQVREGEQNFAGLGLGIETREEARSLALWENELRPRITAEYIRYNLLGNASQFSLVGQLSLVEKRLVATWQQPHFLGLRMRTYFSGYLEKEDRTSFSYERRGLTLSTMRNLPAGFSLLLAAGALRTKLTNLQIAESEVERERLPYSIAYGSATFIQDRRNDTFNPSSGYFFSLALERAYPLLETESNFLKLFAKFLYFYPIAPGINFNTTLRFGLASGTVPIPERFFAGGSNSFRGEAFEMLGPKDPESGLPVGGRSIFLLNMEGRFLLLKKLPNLYGAIFYDVGQVFPEIRDFNFLKLSQAAGLGLRYRTPLGPIRFDVGWNLNPPGNKWKPGFFLTIGNMF